MNDKKEKRIVTLTKGVKKKKRILQEKRINCLADARIL